MKLFKGKKELVSPITNPIGIGNHWKLAKTKNNVSISTDGLNATKNANGKWHSIYAEKGFIIPADFSGPVLFYFEVTDMSSYKKQE
jgi:hypothetical protein